MSETSVASVPNVGQDNVSPTGKEETCDRVENGHEQIIKPSVEADNNNPSPNHVDNNKSPSEHSQASCRDVSGSYFPPPPKYDPTGFYTHGN